MLPFYKVCEWLPFTRAAALRLGLVTLDQMILALVEAVESPVQGTRIVAVPEIRSAGLSLSPGSNSPEPPEIACPAPAFDPKVTSITEAHAHGEPFTVRAARCDLSSGAHKRAHGRNGKDFMDRENRESMDDIHLRILRVTEDLRVIQRELNCAAMQAPTDPELMEALADPPEMESIQVLKSALDQMRHFLWFYMQVVTSDSEMGEKFRQTLRQEVPVRTPEMEQQFQSATDAIMLRYLADSKFRKPN